APTVSVVAPASPTKSTILTATVAFNEAVTGFGAADLSLDGTATGCSIASPVALDPATFAVQVSGCGEGTMGLTLAAGSVADRSSNVGPAAPVSSSLVTIDRTAATASMTAP